MNAAPCRAILVSVLLTGVVALNSSCAAFKAISYTPPKNAQGDPIAGVKGQKLEIKIVHDCNLSLEVARKAKPKQLKGPGREVGAAIPGALLASTAPAIINIVGGELKAKVAELKQPATYSDRLFLKKSDLDKHARSETVCLYLYRFDAAATNAAAATASQVGLALKLKPTARGRHGFSVEMREVHVKNTMVATAPLGDPKIPKVNLAIAIAISGLRQVGGNYVETELAKGALSKGGLPVGTANPWKCPVGSECPQTGLMPRPSESDDDEVTLSLSVDETGSFSDTTLAESEIKALYEALGSALGTGIASEIEYRNSKKAQ